MTLYIVYNKIKGNPSKKFEQVLLLIIINFQIKEDFGMS